PQCGKTKRSFCKVHLVRGARRTTRASGRLLAPTNRRRSENLDGVFSMETTPMVSSENELSKGCLQFPGALVTWNHNSVGF
ncbi:hypothetical protein AKJ16_DCAP13497, partial [Drosera capensis]